eukprot:6756763-Lingulodinium_polyedra.AAC.1
MSLEPRRVGAARLSPMTSSCAVCERLGILWSRSRGSPNIRTAWNCCASWTTTASPAQSWATSCGPARAPRR